MCGIAGVFNILKEQPVARAHVASMTMALNHRGPDDEAVFIDGPVGFGFKRLSIIDIANGNQPFFSEDGSVILICNGEIYNYKELRQELSTKGYKFTTSCDVEVIVHMYKAYGISLLHRLNGQFAFALYDKGAETLYLARDHFGICPLFYAQVNGSWLFASEIKALLKHPEVKRQVNFAGLDQIFSLPGNISPVTMFKNIHSMKPGHFMMVKGGHGVQQEYWDIVYPKMSEPIERKSDAYYEEKLEELLLRSVRYRLNADVPVGFYLSGGLDSSLIGALMKNVGGRNYESFSIIFPGDGEIDESHYQQLLADHIQASSVKIPFDSSEVQRRLQAAVFYAETPLRETYNTCSLALSEKVREKNVKVILSGEGADELLGGYFGYRFDVQRSMNGQSVREVDDILDEEIRERLWGDPSFFYENNEREMSETKKAIYSRHLKEQFPDFDCFRQPFVDTSKLHDRHAFNKRSYLDLKLRLSDHLLSDHCDRVNYANAVEGRYPFLDIDLVEFIRGIPCDLKLNGLVEKYILKNVARKYIPPAICDRQKYGWVAPGSPELLRGNIEWIHDLLSYDRIKRQGYFCPDTVERLKKSYSKEGFRLHTSYQNDLLIVVITFNIFLELFGLPDL